eukprot:m.156473 g.156473  ORF g.156473 m.156473 type:complete len:509 (-) comp14435_c0_seq1:116-1642(-)
MLPTYHRHTTPTSSPARPSLDGLQSRKGSPLRPLTDASPTRHTSWAGGVKAPSPLRKVRRSLHFSQRESTGCSALESALCLTGVLCILVFLVLYDFDTAFSDSRRKPEAQQLRQPTATKLPWRGSNISAYPDDEYAHHWEGKRCERSTGSDGVLPRVLVVGVHKGGSTALFQYLSAHGSVRPSYCKEAHFFDWKYNILKRDFGLGPNDEPSEGQMNRIRTAYRSFFRPQDPDQPPFVSIEGTPSYFHTKEVPPRVKRLLPDTQVVVAMRNPVDRAISHFMGQKAREFKGFRSCNAWFDEYAVLVKRCDKLRPVELGLGGPPKLPLDSKTAAAWDAYTDCILEGDNPVARGLYAPQLYNWLRSYSPGQLYVMQSENLFAEPVDEMQRLTSWLGMRTHFKHEQEEFQVVGSHHMQRFNARFLKTNMGKKDSVFAKSVDCNKDHINTFYKKYEEDMFDLLTAYFPREVTRWKRWSEMDSPGVGSGSAAHKALQDAGVVPKVTVTKSSQRRR